MKNAISLFLISASMLVASASFAETVFYRKNTKIESVNCEDNTLILGDFGRPQISIRSDYDKEIFGDICMTLERFAENNKNSKSSGKTITLLTVEKKSIGDFIYEQEVIGVLDIDNIVAAISTDERDPVYKKFCGTLGGSGRSNTAMCLMVSNSGLFFVEFRSVQQYQLSKTRIISSAGNQVSLESKDSKGKTSLIVNSLKTDENTVEVTVSFEGQNSTSAILKK